MLLCGPCIIRSHVQHHTCNITHAALQAILVCMRRVCAFVYATLYTRAFVYATLYTPAFVYATLYTLVPLCMLQCTLVPLCMLQCTLVPLCMLQCTLVPLCMLQCTLVPLCCPYENCKQSEGVCSASFIAELCIDTYKT